MTTSSDMAHAPAARTRSIHPIIDVVPAANFIWQWPKTFLHAGLRRLVDLGQLSSDRARAMAQAFATCEAAPDSLMITPAVLEIIVVRR